MHIVFLYKRGGGKTEAGFKDIEVRVVWIIDFSAQQLY